MRPHTFSYEAAKSATEACEARKRHVTCEAHKRHARPAKGMSLATNGPFVAKKRAAVALFMNFTSASSVALVVKRVREV